MNKSNTHGSGMLIGCAVIFVFGLVPQAFGAAPAGRDNKITVGLYTAGESVDATSQLFKTDAFDVHVVTNDSLSDFCSTPSNVLVIPPRQLLHLQTEIRIVLDAFLKKAGNLLILNPDALAFDATTLSGAVTVTATRTLADFTNDSAYTLVKDPKSRLTSALCTLPDRGRVLTLSTAEKIGGSAFVECPAALTAEPTQHALEVAAVGDPQFDLLTVKAFDGEGNCWVGFAELTSRWDVYRFAFSDLLAVKPNTKAIGRVSASEIKRIQVGLDSKVIWGEAGGSIRLGAIKLLTYNRPRYAMSGGIIQYRPQFVAAGADYPDWLFDPLVGRTATDIREARFSGGAFAQRGELSVSGKRYFLPEQYINVGGNPESFLDVVARKATRRIPLIEGRNAAGQTGSLARLDVYSDGAYRGATVGLFGLDAEDYANASLGAMIRSVVRYMAVSPKILDCTTRTPTVGRDGHFQYKVYVHNPRSTAVQGTFRLNLAGGRMTASAGSSLAPGKVSEVLLDCGVVPETFPFSRFDLKLAMQTPAGSDFIDETIDIEKTLKIAADHLIRIQPNNFMDAAYTHWFYSDAYAARMLRAFGEYAGNPNYVNSAMRWAHMMAATQEDSGAFPMGYGMKDGSYFIADNGSIALAMLQLASYGADYEKRLFVDAVRKNFDWRQTYLVTPERSKELEAQYGPDAPGTKVGNYGIGLVMSDLVTNKPGQYETAQPEYRGVWYTLACTMGYPPALAKFDPSPRYREGAIADARCYIEQDLTSTGSYAPEGLIWLYAYLDDAEVKSMLRDRIGDKFLGWFRYSAERFWLSGGARQTLLLSPLVYSVHHIENSSRTRAALLGVVVGMCGDYSPYSMLRVALDYHKATYSKANNEGLMYLSFGAMGLMDILEADSTMLKPELCK